MVDEEELADFATALMVIVGEHTESKSATIASSYSMKHAKEPFGEIPTFENIGFLLSL
jgi:hypothetical protein